MADLVTMLLDLVGVAVNRGRDGLDATRRWKERREVARRVRSTPICSASSLATGLRLAAVQGRARALRLLEAPLSREPVIGFRLRVDCFTPAGERLDYRLLDVSRIEEHEVIDETGAVLVKPARALLLGRPTARDPVEFAVDLTRPQLELLVLQEGHTISELVASSGLKASESLLRPDSSVYVCGHPERVVSGSGDSDYRRPPTRGQLVAQERDSVLVADCHRDELLASLKLRTTQRS